MDFTRFGTVDAVPIRDWVMEDTRSVVRRIIEKSGGDRKPVGLLFQNPSDLDEYRMEGGYSLVPAGGRYYLIGSSYSDASFLESELTDRGYKPEFVHYGDNFVIFEFKPQPRSGVTSGRPPATSHTSR